MPELPEIETIRRGLAMHLPGRQIVHVTVGSPRSVRDNPGGAEALINSLTGAHLGEIGRRGKYLWAPLHTTYPVALDTASDTRGDLPLLVMHMRMSGQLRIDDPVVPAHKHQHITALLDSGVELRFIDQRTFGGWWIDHHELVHGVPVPASMAHIGPDLLELLPTGEDDTAAAAQRLATAIATYARSGAPIKSALLNQGIVSGIGNIYADEMLWCAGIDPRRHGKHITPAELARLVVCGRDVLLTAISEGGTSFDALYVNVNGESGYFAHSLNAYGRDGKPCRRCGALLTRTVIANRSAHWCPGCQH